MGTIVVGVDGSPDSRRALRWSIDEARLRGDEVQAVHAWTYPVAVGMYEAVIPLPDTIDLAKEAANFLEREVKEVSGDESVIIRREVVQGPAAPVLVEASREADMLVVGSRGLGGFRSLLLGSVSQQCAHHAHCPVVIVPREDRGS